MARIKAVRYHDFCAGHRVYGHESKCAHLHGHNYRVHFHCEADDLDAVGRVIDFSAIKEHLCEWLEEKWDHRFLVYCDDPLKSYLMDLDKTVTVVPFNPTAENMAKYLATVIAPDRLKDTGIVVTKVVVEETRKCFAEYEV